MKPKAKEKSLKLSFPDVVPLDFTRNCPRYASVLSRSNGDGVGIEEIDNLQMELESLLVNAIERKRKLKIELMVLENQKDKTDSFKLQKTLSQPSTPKTPNHIKKIKSMGSSGKPGSVLKPTEGAILDTSATIVRNEIPDLFWQSVEPYVSDITEDDIKMLEDQIDIHDKIMTQTKLVPLGTHYSIKWAEEDLKHEMRESNKLSNDNLNGSKKKGNDNSIIDQNNINNILEDGKKVISNDNDSSYGPLTQRLISALIEQNLMTPFDTDMTDLEMLGDPKGQHMSPRTLAKQLNITTSQSLEKKIKKELIEQGILDEEDFTDSQDEGEEKIDKDDEIAIEIKRLQSELEMVSSTCKKTQQQLLSVAKEVMKQQEIKKKIDSIDNEIKDLFQKSKSLKMNKKSLPKKEKERAQKLLKDREQLKHDLNEFLIPALNL